MRYADADAEEDTQKVDSPELEQHPAGLPAPEPDSGVITAMIKPEPGAILGGRRKPGQ